MSDEVELTAAEAEELTGNRDVEGEEMAAIEALEDELEEVEDGQVEPD